MTERRLSLARRDGWLCFASRCVGWLIVRRFVQVCSLVHWHGWRWAEIPIDAAFLRWGDYAEHHCARMALHDARLERIRRR